MRFITGDDIGILKTVRVEAQKVERFGPQRRGDGVARMAWAGPEATPEDRIAVAFASGAIELRDGKGTVLESVEMGKPDVTSLQALGGANSSDFFACCRDGTASVVKGWRDAQYAPAAPDSEEAAARMASFQLPGDCVVDAKVDPTNMGRLLFGGGDNDVKIWDLETSAVTWRAKNVRESQLCLRVPVDVGVLQWATPLTTSRSMIICGTRDGKVRVYDANTQRKPLFELVVGHGAGAGTGGYTGTVDEVARPLNCSAISSVRGDKWGFFAGNTMGVLREYDLRNLSTVQAAPYKPGRKSHLDWAGRQMPFRRGYKGIMGSIRDVGVHCSGEAVVAVGLGRFAYVFQTRKKMMTSKVFMKQQLNSVLISSEEYKTKDAESDVEQEEPEEEVGADAGDNSEDELKEGFSDDEDGAGRAGGESDSEAGDLNLDLDADDDEDDDGSDADSDSDDDDAAPVAKKSRGKAPVVAKADRQQTTVIMPGDDDEDEAPAPAPAATGEKATNKRCLPNRKRAAKRAR